MTVTTSEYWTANGVVLNTLGWNIRTLEGREGLPPREGSNPIAGAVHGTRWVKKRFGERPLVLNMWIQGSDDDGVTSSVNAQFRQRIEDLKAIFGSDLVYLEQRRVTVDQGLVTLNTVAEYVSFDFAMQHAGHAEVVIELNMPDPFWYGQLKGMTLAPPAPASGAEFPTSFPVNFGPGGSPGGLTIRNDGSYETRNCLWRVNGPVTSPSIDHLGRGESMQLDIDLLAGEYLDVSTLDRTVLLNGSTSRAGTWIPGSKWFPLDAGDNEIRYRLAAGSGSVGLLWADAYL